MKTRARERRIISAACLMVMACLGGPAAAQSPALPATADAQGPIEPAAQRRQAAARKHVDEAVVVVRKMGSEPRMKELLEQAKGVFIVPTYGRAALGVGASGGFGVLLAKAEDGSWSEPAFYNLGGLSAGAQAGAEAGAIAMVLNNEKAVSRFMQKNAFSLRADAGLTIVNWSRTALGAVGTGDVIAWAGTKGLYGNLAAVGVSDIRFNQRLTDAYYNKKVSPRDVLTGQVKNAQADTLRQTLASTSATPTSGASTGGTEASGKPRESKPRETP